MRVLLTSHGSTGDIYPVIRLGKALADAGHEVRMATCSFFREDVERAGIHFVRVPPDWDQTGFAEAMRDLSRVRNPIRLLCTIYNESLPFFDEIIAILIDELKTADVFVSSYLFSQMSALAESEGVPSAVTTFVHSVVPSLNHPPDTLPRLLIWPATARRIWNKALWKIADFVVCWNINRVIGAALERNGVHPLKSFFLQPADKALVTVSKSLFQPQHLWSDRFEFTGYLRWQACEAPEKEKELSTFCEGHEVPILTFGSVTFDNARKIMHRFIENWPRGKKIIVQSGWAGLTIEKPHSETLVVGKMSHDQLFRYGSVVIHHGGAGTTASVLHSGKPQIIIPHMGDQWFFAREIKRLGVGLQLERKKWPEQLPDMVRKIENRKKYRRNAQKVADILAREDGPTEAVRVLEALASKGKPEKS